MKMSLNDYRCRTKDIEKRTLIIIFITVLAMFAEIFYGYTTNSMALLADGYHMGVHALSFGITYAAYFISRKFADRGLSRKSSDKVCVLAGYTSSIFLGITGIWIIVEGIKKFFGHEEIRFNEALIVASIGLFVNVISVFILGEEHHHLDVAGISHKETETLHNREVEHEDYNFKSAYYHILSDILTSVFAVISLIFCKYFSIAILDPIVGTIGGILILKWAVGLLKKTSFILIDLG